MDDAKVIEQINQVGYFLRRKKRFDSALRVFRALRRLQPEYGYPHLGEALVHAEAGDFAAAKLHLQIVLSRQPENSFALACLGLAMLQSGDGNWRVPMLQAANTTDSLGGKQMAREILAAIDARGQPRAAAPVCSTAGRLKRSF
ncbi:tetratricopeptide repeat family protein [Burkholderia thailandensis MSMB121]|uniref:HrpB1 family type III secretion system apparatus protein n=1 Tax=Burkholderia humptydooensis TaxID=430531 RepID=UPI0003280185|nr:HrpB1 family type III secretion system apparatus protein [Burkholderia humptydooensis]AGK50861.1 tetratricopeptide repeat family protein [Burkholderia thailandensis MSMB121]ATF32276.1 hypothetical protein CO709_01795 [Burkholderia thailandensis]KST72342.1 hypothetical protein WS76_28120 [Burkholderia humptydooensis]